MYDDERWSLIAAHRERLLRMARRRCSTPADAEDVVQEALLRCATFVDLDGARIGQFLTSVTTRLCADTHRHAERHARAVGRLGDHRTPDVDPADLACRDAEVERLAGLLATLPDRQRSILVDRAAGLSVGEIGGRHALSYKAVESALSRARVAMRMALGSAATALVSALALPRKRAVAVAGVPVAALAFLTAVDHGLLALPRDRDRGRAERLVDAGETRRTTRPPAASGARSAVMVTSLARPPAPGPAKHWAGHPQKGDIVRVKDPVFGSEARAYDHTDHEPPSDTVARCLHDGAWVYVQASVEAVTYMEGCGPPPRHGPDSTVVHVDPTP